MVLKTMASRTFKRKVDFHLVGEGVCELEHALAVEMRRMTSERLQLEAAHVALDLRKLLTEGKMEVNQELVANVSFRTNMPTTHRTHSADHSTRQHNGGPKEDASNRRAFMSLSDLSRGC